MGRERKRERERENELFTVIAKGEEYNIMVVLQIDQVRLSPHIYTAAAWIWVHLHPAEQSVTPQNNAIVLATHNSYDS